MNYSKVMLRVFSSSEAEKDFQKKFSEALDLAETEGSAKLQSDEGDDDVVDIQVDKNEDGSFTITDNVNDETTIAKENAETGETILEKQESDPEPVKPVKEDYEKVTITEVTPDEEYRVKTSTESFSVKGDFKKALKVAKRFSDYVEMDLTEVTDNMNPEKRVPADTGIDDPEKAGTPEARAFAASPDKIKAIHNALEEAEKSGKPYTNEDIAKKVGCKVEDVTEARKTFSTEGTEAHKNEDEKDNAKEALEAAKEHAKEDEDGAIVKTESATVHVKYDKETQKFSYTKIDLKSRNFSDIPEDNIVAELEGTNMDPEKNMPADKGIIDPEKAGTPEARQFSQEQVDAALAKDAKDETEEDKAALKEAADAGCEKSKAKLAEIQACDSKKYSNLEEGVDQLEKKAEEVATEPTEENAQSLKNDAEELEKKVVADKTYSAIKKEVMLNRIKFYSEVANSALASAKLAPANISEEQSRQFSDLLKFDTKIFASKEQIEAATKTFSDTEGAAENPCLTAQF